MIKSSTYNGHLLTMDGDFKCSVQEHYQEKMEYICTYQKCTADTRLCCQQCKQKYHGDHSQNVHRIREFTGQVVQESQKVLDKFSNLLNTGDTEEIYNERLQRQISQKVDEMVKSYTSFLKSLKIRLKEFIASKGYLYQAEHYNIMSEIEDFNLGLKRILSKNWKFQSKDDIEILVKIFRQDNFADYLQTAIAEIDRNIYVKTIKDKLDIFFGKTQYELLKLIEDADKELNIIEVEHFGNTKQKVLKRSPPKGSSNHSPQKEKTLQQTSSARALFTPISSRKKKSSHAVIGTMQSTGTKQENVSSERRPNNASNRLLHKIKPHSISQHFETEPSNFLNRKNIKTKKQIINVNQNQPISTNDKYKLHMDRNIFVMGFDQNVMKGSDSEMPEILNKRKQKKDKDGKHIKFEDIFENSFQNEKEQQKIKHVQAFKNIVFESSDEEKQKNKKKQQSQKPKQNYDNIVDQPDSMRQTHDKFKNSDQKEPSPNEKVKKYTAEQKAAFKKWLNIKKITTQNPTKVAQYVPNENVWEVVPDIKSQQVLMKEVNQRYGKLEYHKIQKLMENDKEVDEFEEGGDKRGMIMAICEKEDDENERLFHTESLPCIIKDVIQYDSVKNKEGNIYDGEWKNGKREGRGAYYAVDGSLYVGMWKDDKAFDYGRIVHANGNMYEGHWKDGQADGFGKFIYNGNDDQKVSTYIGDFVIGKRSGKGKFLWADGSSYQGEFKDNMIHGIGLYKWKDGKQYYGQWEKGKMHGKGKFTWSDTRFYQGEYINDKKQGYGKMVWPQNQKIYEGEWLEDQPHGIGIMQQGEINKKGQWDKGKQIKWFEEENDQEYLNSQEDKRKKK